MGLNFTQRFSKYSVSETIDHLVAFLQDHGVTVYARINQQSEARRAGITIGPLECLLFGNPANGGPIMAANPLASLDLPLKIIAWEGPDGKTRIAYEDARRIEARFGIPHELVQALDLGPLLTRALGQE